MRVHRAVGENERDVAAAFAARFEVVELEAGEVVDEVRLPHVLRRRLVAAAVVRVVLAAALEMLFGAGALGELERVGEDEIEVVIEVDRQRRVVGARDPRGLLA